jgi:cytochrome P450
MTETASTPPVVYPARWETSHRPPAEYVTGPAIRRCRILYGGTGWLVTGMAAARAVLADSETFSSDTTRPEFPSVPLASKRPIPGHFLMMDPPEHTRLRRLVATELSPGRSRARTAAVTEVANTLVDELVAAGRGADLVETVAGPLAALNAATVFGIPVADTGLFTSIARRLQRHDATAAQRIAASGELNRYFARAIPAARGSTSPDLLRVLAAALDDGFELDELIGVANLTSLAGLETTAGLLSLTLLSLFEHPDQGDLVRADPRAWAGPAVNEALRYWTLVQHGVVRVATRGAVVAGQSIQAGEALLVSLPAANRDSAAYDRPHDFDLTRDARQHLSFGHGAHRCPGAPISTAQVELAVATLLTRLPGLRPACAPHDLSFLDDMFIYGLRRLPVTW